MVLQNGLDVLVEALPRFRVAATAWPVTLMGDAARARIASLDWPRLEPLWRSVLALS